MAVRTVLELDIDSSKFDAVAAHFDKFKKAVDEQPEAWRDIGKEVEAVGNAMRETNEQVEQQTDHMNRLVISERRFVVEATAGSRAWKEIAKSVKEVSQDAIRVTGGGAGGGGGGLGLAGILGRRFMPLAALGAVLGLGFEGLKKTGAFVAGTSAEGSTAFGLRTSPGALRAFAADFGRYADENMPARVAQAMWDPHTAGQIRALTGIGPEGDPTRVSVKLMEALLRRTAGMNPMMTGMMINAYGLGGVIDTETINRLRSAPAAERDRVFGDFERQAYRLGNKPEDMRAIQEVEAFRRRTAALRHAREIALGGAAAKQAIGVEGKVEDVQDKLSQGITKTIDGFFRLDKVLGEFADDVARYLGRMPPKPGMGLPDQPASTLPPKPPIKGSALPPKTTVATMTKYLGPLGVATAAGSGGYVDAAFGSLQRENAEIGLKGSTIEALASALARRGQQIVVENRTGSDITAIAAAAGK